MREKTPRPLLWFYVIVGYVLLQFTWWGYYLIDLSGAVYPEKELNDRVLMILGEGAVFLTLLFVAIYQLRKSIKKELGLNQEKTNFLLSVTHELKTPLSSVKLMLQTLQSRKLPEEKRAELLEKALAENERLTSMIENLLLASGIEERQVFLNRIRRNLSRFVSTTLDDLKTLYPNHVFKTNIEADILFRFDEHYFYAILSNLISNAVKYSPEGSEVTLNLKSKSGKVVLEVSDQGQGIKEKEDVLKKFYREGNEETRSSKGTGLGLFIVHKVVELHQGKIQIENNQPRGTVVRIKFKNE